MRFQVSGHLEYAVTFPSTLILNIHAQRNSAQTILEESFIVDPPVKHEEFLADNGESRFVRLETGQQKQITIDYKATVDCLHEALPAAALSEVDVAHLNRSAIPFLFPSRYCQSDMLGRLAWDLFGEIEKPFDKVTAIVDWIHSNVEYLLGSTDSATSAYDTVTQRTGVCRDFAHLGIALCRALNIPARYFSGYSYLLDPADFHACFECHVGGRWLLFDATRLAPLNGLVRIGSGRDAAEAAVASIFGRVRCTAMQVDCQLAPDQQFTPMDGQQLSGKGVSLESRSVPPAN